ncbi:CRISPR-associated endonuclease Cas2 [Candidatus Haliotispira prima]|uniref:CRISPR-associated endoribonuclease Cas2 n=1 Tax=Candidatus Haliotispira prima TaxID=3034016 RepID=A0ABY8MG88_9SPIO|nr:CRISPR-associated endonuclease Cas2 [Candidatus Haliotispira prima]
MLLISYDISDNKLRSRFAKLLERYGERVQYSVFEVRNSERLLNLLKTEIEGRYSKFFTGADNIRIYQVNNNQTISYGNALHREQNVLYLE